MECTDINTGERFNITTDYASLQYFFKTVSAEAVYKDTPISQNIALELKKIADKIPNGTSVFRNMHWTKQLQFLYNAYVVENSIISVSPHDIFEDTTFNGSTSSHTTVTGGYDDNPDLVSYVDGMKFFIEVKLLNSRSAITNLSKKQLHIRPDQKDKTVVLALCLDLKQWVWATIDGDILRATPLVSSRSRRGSNNKKQFDSETTQAVSDAIKSGVIPKITLPDPSVVISQLIDISSRVPLNIDTQYIFVHKLRESLRNSKTFLLESHGQYYNKLDLTKALENKDECIKLIRDQFGYDGPIETGGFYIMPDGTVIKSVNHADIDKFLIRNKYITGKVEDYGDGSQFMEAINCVRLRRRGGRDSWILPYMILPEEQLTQAQYNVVRDWIDFVILNSGELSIQTMTGECKVYHRSDDASDIMMDIHRYYRLHFFEDYESVFEPEIDSTNYRLEKDLEKGFYDQF